GSIAQQPNGHGFLPLGVMAYQLQSVIKVTGLLVQITRFKAKINTVLLTLHGQRGSARKGGGQRLGTTHAAQSGGEYPSAGQAAVIMLATGLGEGFVGALHNALATNVYPASCRHLPEHEQAVTIQLVKGFPVGPLGDQIGVGNQYARGIGCGLEYTHRLARLDKQGLVHAQCFQGGKNLVIAGPVAGSAPDATVDHQMLGLFSHRRIQIVLNHAVSGFSGPALAVQRGTCGSVNRTLFIVTGVIMKGNSIYRHTISPDRVITLGASPTARRPETGESADKMRGILSSHI